MGEITIFQPLNHLFPSCFHHFSKSFMVKWSFPSIFPSCSIISHSLKSPCFPYVLHMPATFHPRPFPPSRGRSACPLPLWPGPSCPCQAFRLSVPEELIDHMILNSFIFSIIIEGPPCLVICAKTGFIFTGWWCNNHLETYESQWEGASHISWKITNVWNHQPV